MSAAASIAAPSGTTRRRIDSFDIAKGILCIVIVMIHVNPFPDSIRNGIYPAARIAVPLFFLMTGYLFFSRYNSFDDPAKQKALYRKQMKRLLVMYFAWFLILLAPTLRYRGWFDKGLTPGLIEMVRSTICGSSFIASWYLMACIIGLTLLVICKRYLPEKLTWVIAIFFFLNACMYSNYYNAAANVKALAPLMRFWRTTHINPAIGFPVGFFWLTLADALTQRMDKVIAWFEKTGALPFMLFFGLACLYFEWYCVGELGWTKINDCYLFLAPSCACLFVSLLMCPVSCAHGVWLRNWSSITYVMHATTRYVLVTLFDKYQVSYSKPGLFLLVLLICSVVSAAIIWLSQRKRLAFLKWLY